MNDIDKTKHRFHYNAEPSEARSDGMPKEMYKAEFARRLNRAMVRKGWNQSELARQTKLHTPKGASPVTRDLVSKYISGKILPAPVKAQILCDTLGIKREEMLPVGMSHEAGEALPQIDVRDAGEGLVWLRVNKSVEWPKAIKILEILKGA